MQAIAHLGSLKHIFAPPCASSNIKKVIQAIGTDILAA
jgi:hypothetical protein